QLPFDAPTVPAILAKQMTEAAPALGGGPRAVPRVLADAVERCLSKQPSERFASGEALADALELRDDGVRELPVPLRVWLKKADPLAPVYAIWAVGVAGSGVQWLVTFAHSSSSLSWALRGVGLIAIGLGLPLIGHVKVRLFQTRQ